MKQQKIIKAGNSLAITLPAKIVRALGLKPKDTVSVSVQPDLGSITYHFDQPRQLTLTSNNSDSL